MLLPQYRLDPFEQAYAFGCLSQSQAMTTPEMSVSATLQYATERHMQPSVLSMDASQHNHCHSTSQTHHSFAQHAWQEHIPLTQVPHSQPSANQPSSGQFYVVRSADAAVAGSCATAESSAQQAAMVGSNHWYASSTNSSARHTHADASINSKQPPTCVPDGPPAAANSMAAGSATPCRPSRSAPDSIQHTSSCYYIVCMGV